MPITLLRWSLALVLGFGAGLLLLALARGGHPGAAIAVIVGEARPAEVAS